MKKLLHERLREVTDECSSIKCKEFALIVDAICGEFDSCSDCFKTVSAALANEIEKYYQPKPRDQEGEPCSEGDILYSIYDGSMYTVEKLGSDIPKDAHEMIISNKNGASSRAIAKFFTHREPDSLEKLRDDMDEYNQNMHFADIANEYTFNEFVARLTAIMECDECAITPETGEHEYISDAIEAWNARADRTCHFISTSDGNICSSCESNVSRYCNPYDVEFCPNCGAKVVKE